MLLGQPRSVECGRERNLEGDEHQLCLRENILGAVNILAREFGVRPHSGRYGWDTIRIEHDETATGCCLVATAQVGKIYPGPSHPGGPNIAQSILANAPHEMRW